MKLESFGISNFKAFGQDIQRLPLKPITLIFGPNSAGKSSLVQALLWSLHSARVGDFESRVSESASGSVDLGDFRTLLHHKEKERRIDIEFSFSDTDSVSPVRVVHQLGITTHADLMRYRKTLNSELEVAVDFENTEIAFHKANGMIEHLFDFKVPEAAEVMRIILDDNACLEQIETSLRRNVELEWDELCGYEDLGGCKPVPDDIVKAYKNAEEARIRLQAIEAEHGEQLQIHWDNIDRILDQECHLCSVLAVEIHQGENLVLRATRPPGGTELEVEVLDGVLAEAIVQAPDLWIPSLSRSTSTESLFSPYKVNLNRDKFQFVSDHAIANALAWLSHVRQHAAELDKQLVYLGPLRHLPERRSLIGVPGEPPANPKLKSWAHLRDQQSLQKRVNQLLERMDCRKYRFQTKLFSTSRDFWGARESINSFRSLHSEDEEAAYAQIDERLKGSSSAEVWTDLVLYDIENQVPVEVRDVGVGISQLVPILIHAGADKNQFIAIEQPELHLHPRLQAELGDVFIESALGENKNTFLIETHSEHLILRILRRIRETTRGVLPEGLVGISPEDVAVLFVEPGSDGSNVREIRISPQGRFIDDWPDGFFEERFNEVF